MSKPVPPYPHPYQYPPPGYWPYYPPPENHQPARSEAPKEPRKASSLKGCAELAAEFALFALAVLLFIAIVTLSNGGKLW